MFISFKLLLFITFLYGLFNQFSCQNVIVNTTRGQVVGYHFDQGNDTTQTWYGQADFFFGIPFALPPVGELRYKYARPLIQYPGPSPYNATYSRSACVQPGGLMNGSSEDCLYVNIWTPNATSTTKYPVMIWIHGGGLIQGDNHDNWGNAGIVRNLVSKGIVVAALEYRMSWLGFFTTFTDDFPPNIGMVDQVLAIKFIKEEITYFGGDPNQITIFGESAGGHSVSSHTYSPLSQNLFQQVITESGNMLTCYEDSVGPTNRNFNFAQNACNYTQEMWDSKNYTALKDCLMKISVADGLAAMSKYGGENWVCWNMVQDNYFFPGNPQQLALKRPNIPAIFGNCKDEYANWELDRVIRHTNLTTYTRQQVEARLSVQYATWLGNQTQTQAVIKIWEDNYLPPGTADDDHWTWLQFAIDVGTSAYFTWGTLRDVEYYLMNKNPNVYTYQFARSSILNFRTNPFPETWRPVIHGCELEYLFGYGNGGNWDAADQALANLVQESWANFAKYGKPTIDGTWKPTTSSDFTALEYFEFNLTSSLKTGFRAKDQVVWNQAIPQVQGDYPPNLPDTHPICSRGYQSKVKNTTCYEAIEAPLAWNAAQTNCAQNSYGALASVGSAFENTDLLGYAKNAYPSCTGFYIGLFRSAYIPNNSNWTWVNYDPIAYRNWRSGSPSQDPNASCVVLNANDGTWTNQACDTPQCYICSY